MTMMDRGAYGAMRQTQKKANPRALLRQIMDSNPGAGERGIFHLYAMATRDDPEMVDVMMEYWFANNYRSLVILAETPHQAPAVVIEKKAAKKQERDAIIAVVKETIKAKAVQMVLLDIVLPNGKPLRDATGKDCAKVGGWLTKIAAKIEPGDVVGKTLSEAEVRKLFGS